MTTTVTTVPMMRKKRIPSTVRSAAQWDGTPLPSIKRVKGAMVLDLDLDSDLVWETELERIRIQALTQHRTLHVRHAPAYTQERLAVVPVARRVWPVPTRMQGKPNEYAETTRTRSCVEHRQSSRCRRITAHKASAIHNNNYTDNSCICVCNYGIPGSARRASRRERGAR
jgi:hypothetical protein